MNPSSDETSSVGITVQLVRDAIAANDGRIPFSRFMEISLFGPQGYYASAQARIGSLGHFTTSPEISPRFGASIGRQLAHTWQAMGRPPRFDIVEMGAGTGSLAEALLGDARLTNPDFFSALHYQIVEYGDLIRPQQERLQQYHDRPSPIVSWIRGSALDLQVGDITGAFISNELFDAFPVEIVTLSGGRVMQMFVEDSEGTPRPTWRGASLDVNRYIRKFGVRIQEGVEEPVNLNAIKLQRTLCASLKRGVILTIDYGESGEVGESDHPAVRVFGEGLDTVSQPERRRRAYSQPGELDLTTSVNFAPLLQIAGENGLRVVYSGPQGGFLRGCGILSFSGGDEAGMPASDSRLISALGMGVHHAQFLAKGIPNLKMRCPTRRAVPSAVALSG